MEKDTVKKQRGRKKKEDTKPTVKVEPEENKEAENDIKRRGRKPKGGKLIQKTTVEQQNVTPVSNIILHLRCSLKDLHCYYEKQNETLLAKNPLEYNPIAPPEIKAYDTTTNIPFGLYNSEPEKTTPAYNAGLDFCKNCANKPKDSLVLEETEDDINIKDLNAKLKKLRIQFYKNSFSDKKSACFWCTYDFDNPPCFIPKYEMNDEIVGYGTFCRPECAVGYLMRENLDDSTKFERYFLLNQIYAKVYGFRKNIKPAPVPHYLLDKFYGNLNIQEYRKLLKTENMLTIMEKPMTRILPEIHEDNDEFVIGIYGGTKQTTASNSGNYKVKRQSEKQSGPSKMDIMREKFGM